MRGIKHDYVAIARFRTALRAYDNAAADAARGAGLTPQRYLLLLLVKGAPDGREEATVSELADRLKVAPHTVTGAASRAERAGLVVRRRCDEDRRRTWIRLTPEGERRLGRAVAAAQAQRDGLLEVIDELAADARAVEVRPASRGRVER
jgi:DNA-binding MarR family transcriptional regulator